MIYGRPDFQRAAGSASSSLNKRANATRAATASPAARAPTPPPPTPAPFQHEHCFLCRRARPAAYVYYADYKELDAHFKCGRAAGCRAR